MSSLLIFRIDWFFRIPVFPGIVLLIVFGMTGLNPVLGQGPPGGGNISITAPGDQQITHDLTNNNQGFSKELWDVKANAPNGAVLTIEADAFTNKNDTQYSRPIKLELSLESSKNGRWTITTSSDDTTDGNTAKVEAESTGADEATFGLITTFLENTTATIAPDGTYETTVTGTLTEK